MLFFWNALRSASDNIPYLGGGLVLVAGLVSSLAMAEPLRYDEIPVRLQKNNGFVQGAQAAVEAARRRTHYLEWIYLPDLKLKLGAEALYTGGTVTAIEPLALAELSIDLGRSGPETEESKIRDQELTLAEWEAKVIYQKELVSAQGFYWDMLYYTELGQRSKEVLKLNERALASARQRLARGLLPRSDVLAFELYRSQLDEDIESYEHEALLSKIRLLAVLGMDAQRDLSLADTSLPRENADTLLTREFKVDQHPEWQILITQQRVQLAQREKLVRQSASSLQAYTLASLYTERDRSYTTLTDRIDLAAGVSWQYAPLQLQRLSEDLAAEDLRADSFEQSMQQWRKQVMAEFAATQDELRYLSERVQNSHRLLIRADEFLKLMLQDYALGVKNAGEMLASIQSYMQYQSEDVQRRRDYQETKGQLMRLLAGVIR